MTQHGNKKLARAQKGMEIGHWGIHLIAEYQTFVIRGMIPISHFLVML